MSGVSFRDYKNIGGDFHGFVMALGNDFRKNTRQPRSEAMGFWLDEYLVVGRSCD
jgi:hypothetical protein